MKEIKLNHGQVTIVDDEDFEKLSKFKWGYNNRGYAVRNIVLENEKQAILYMHVAIMGKVNGLEVDHVNRIPLDNRRKNLRHVTHRQNMQNQGSSKDSTSKYKGVCLPKGGKSWISQITVNGKTHYLGSYESELDAALAYNKAALPLGGYILLNVFE